MKEETTDIVTDGNIKSTSIVQESEYKAAELAAVSKNAFNVSPDCVIAALRVAGKEKATLKEAKEIIYKFTHKEVKN
jgi:hypothetical protein